MCWGEFNRGHGMVMSAGYDMGMIWVYADSRWRVKICVDLWICMTSRGGSEHGAVSEAQAPVAGGVGAPPSDVVDALCQTRPAAHRMLWRNTSLLQGGAGVSAVTGVGSVALRVDGWKTLICIRCCVHTAGAAVLARPRLWA
jgi:hypothetical protein